MKVNHKVGEGWLVVLVSEEPIDYDSLQLAMGAWSDKMLSRGFKVTPRLLREPCRIPLTITDVQKILDEKEKKGDRGEKRTIWH